MNETEYLIMGFECLQKELDKIRQERYGDKYRIEFNNNEVEVMKEFSTYKEAFDYGVDLGGQWGVVKVEGEK